MYWVFKDPCTQITIVQKKSVVRARDRVGLFTESRIYSAYLWTRNTHVIYAILDCVALVTRAKLRLRNHESSYDVMQVMETFIGVNCNTWIASKLENQLRIISVMVHSFAYTLVFCSHRDCCFTSNIQTHVVKGSQKYTSKAS